MPTETKASKADVKYQVLHTQVGPFPQFNAEGLPFVFTRSQFEQVAPPPESIANDPAQVEKYHDGLLNGLLNKKRDGNPFPAIALLNPPTVVVDRAADPTPASAPDLRLVHEAEAKKKEAEAKAAADAARAAADAKAAAIAADQAKAAADLAKAEAEARNKVK